MPKQKSHSGTKKRFRKTGTGKIMRGQRGLNHFLSKKSSRHKRSLTGPVEVAEVDDKRIRKLLG